jgi:predicted DNA-binding transcriptional regulator AlpA
MSERTLQDGPQPVKSEKRLITDRELRRRLGDISPVTLWRLRTIDPRCPKPVRLMAHYNVCVEDEADAYIQALVSERNSSVK